MQETKNSKRELKRSGLMFPKEQAKKKHRAHAAHSILQSDRDRRRCWLCMQLRGDYSEHTRLHKHHIFGGHALRRISEAEGFFVWLCPEHHEFSGESAHTDQAIAAAMKAQAQTAYEKGHTREQFRQLMGKSYITDDGKRGRDGENSLCNQRTQTRKTICGV